jgi:cytochrome c-type biogenesis protein CcmH/NrfG
MTQNTSSQKPLVQRILIIFSGLAFLGTTAFGTASLFMDAFKEPTDSAKTAATAKNTELEAQAKGFETVLQREPDNQLALQGLVQTRLQMNDTQGATALLEKLIQQNPKNQIALEELAKVRLVTRDAKGALEPLEKLVELHPDREDYKAALAQVKQEVEKEKPTSNP